MNFQDLKKIETPDFYLDVAFRKAKQKADLSRLSLKKDSKRINKSKDVELERIAIVRLSLMSNFDKIIRNYPSLDNLTEFYKELINATLDYEKLKKALGAVNSAKLVTNDIYKKYSLKIKKSQELPRINQHRREFYGRISSIPKRIKKELEYLELARRTMRNYPAVKSGLPTVAIAGFPNVGKSTLLKKLTTAKPEINEYPFTTKILNIGYMEIGYHKIQLIDTPGTLNRFDKMNPIEKIAHLAMKYVAEKIIYVFDPTEEYSKDDQEKLLKRTKEFDKELIIYLSKADIADKEKVDEYKKDHPKLITDSEKIKELKFT